MSRWKDVVHIGFVLGHGGDAQQMLDAVTGISATGRPARIIVPALESTVEFAERCRARGIEVERSPLIRAHMYSSRQNFLAVMRLLRANRDALIHFHTGNVCLPRAVLLAMALLRMPRAFVTVQGPYETLRPGSIQARMWAWGVRRHFHRVFCPSRHSRDAQLTYGVSPEQAETVYNGIDVERFRTGNGTLPRRYLDLPADARLIVFSSRIDPQKRPLDAIAAFERVAAEFPNTHLVFVGTGQLEAEAAERAKTLALLGRVHFAGYHNNIPDWLAAATVWLFPTDSENFSLAVIEALAAGCPIISTECQGNDEVLIHERNALVTRVGDVEAQADCLRRLLSDNALRLRLGAEAARTGARYSIGSVVQSYLHAYSTLAGVGITGISNQIDVPESLLSHEQPVPPSSY